MPYCRNCGKEIDENNLYCQNCQGLLEQPSRYKEQRITQPSNKIGELIGVIALLVILIVFVVFATTIQIFDCPNCNNEVLTRWACGYCGQDGKVSLWDLIRYSLR